MSDVQRRSSITTKGVVPIPNNRSQVENSPKAQTPNRGGGVSGSQSPTAGVSMHSKTNPNVRTGTRSTSSGSVTSNPNSKTQISPSSQGSGSVSSDPNSKTQVNKPSRSTQSSEIKSQVQQKRSNQTSKVNASAETRSKQTSKLAESADARDKYGRTPKQKRKEDFIVSTIATVVLLGVVSGGLYYGYTVAMGILG